MKNPALFFLTVEPGSASGPPPDKHPEEHASSRQGGKLLVYAAAVLRLQAVSDALFHLLAAPQEAAAISGKLLPWAPPVLLLLPTAGEEFLYIVTETNLMKKRGRKRHQLSNTKKGQRSSNFQEQISFQTTQLSHSLHLYWG